jgi:hypothetical protein
VAYLALSPVTVAVYTALNVAGLTALATGGIYDDVPQAPSFPFVWYEVREARDLRGFGTGGLPEVELRVHVFSTYEGAAQVQSLTAKVVELLKDVALTVTGYAQCGRVFYDATSEPFDELLNGQHVREQVSQFRIYVEQT